MSSLKLIAPLLLTVFCWAGDIYAPTRTRHRMRHHQQRQYMDEDRSWRVLHGSNNGRSSNPKISADKLYEGSLEKDQALDFEQGRYVPLDAVDAANKDTELQGNCTSCVAREQSRVTRIEQVKRDILAKLGLKEPPNVTAPIHNPHIFKLKNEIDKRMLADEPIRQDDEDSVQAKKERIFSMASRAPDSLGFGANNPVAYFTFSGETLQSYVDRSILHFYVRPSPDAVDLPHPLKMNLYKILEIGDSYPVKQLISTKEIKPYIRGRWEIFDVHKIVDSWLAKPTRNYGLVVEIMHGGENLAVVPADDDTEHPMYLELDLTEKHSVRRKRHSEMRIECENDQETRCCRHKLVVDFGEFGWDFIVAPKRYVANYCNGECQNQHLQQYLHTHMVQTANPNGPGPCCSPSDMGNIQMIYYNNDNEMVMANIPGMVVKRCACA